jgi:hypothetical protein
MFEAGFHVLWAGLQTNIRGNGTRGTMLFSRIAGDAARKSSLK